MPTFLFNVPPHADERCISLSTDPFSHQLTKEKQKQSDKRKKKEKHKQNEIKCFGFGLQVKAADVLARFLRHSNKM